MATRTFLTAEEFSQAEHILKPPLAVPKGQVTHDHSLTAALDFSSWLSLMIENRLREVPGWEEAHPIAIGSWGRGELCPGSDLDVVFCGSAKAVEKVVTHVEGLGLKFRYRVPEDLSDWTKGVEVLETNALFRAKAFTQKSAEKLQQQKELILQNKGKFRRDLRKAIMVERRERFKRYDSIANFLEPNLKFGSGGLRDLHQGLMLRDWYPERFNEDDYSLKLFDYYRCFFLLIRQRLHLNQTHDILTANDQHELCEWFGFNKHRDFMVQVQQGLSRVSFYSDWTSERCGLTKKAMEGFKAFFPQTWAESLKALQKDNSLQVQARIRRQLHETKAFKSTRFSKKDKGKVLKKLLDIKTPEDVTIAGFRSHMMSHLIPSFTPIVGLVQHDQYHRFTVDAHLVQALREVQRIHQHPKLLGRLEYYAEKLKLKDWNVLRWAALYHDMAKGQKGDHSRLGKELVIKDLKSFGFNKEFYSEVAWLVEHHLIMSTAAFRMNPQSPKTWEYLFSRGVKGPRIYLLAIFTAIDIRATNPEAWSSWKESLLNDIVETLRNPGQQRHFEFSQRVKKLGLNIPDRFIRNLDPRLVESLSEKRLINDFQQVLAGEELPPAVVKDRSGRVWVRFHKKTDKAGLVLQFTESLTHLGCNIRQAFIHTDPQMGVYDWFCVKTSKSAAILKKQLAHGANSCKIYNTKFSHIDWVSLEKDDWVLSFRAKDKKGLLLTAMQALYELGLEIQWAKVHTWGRQIDDIIGLHPHPEKDPQEILKTLRSQISQTEFEIL